MSAKPRRRKEVSRKIRGSYPFHYSDQLGATSSPAPVFNLCLLLIILVGVGGISAQSDFSVSATPSHLVTSPKTNISLVCTSTIKPILCLWKTPYGHIYTLSEGVFAESGRLRYLEQRFSSDNHCGLEIVGVELRDQGRWECEVGAVIHDDFRTKTDRINLDVKESSPRNLDSNFGPRPNPNQSNRRISTDDGDDEVPLPATQEVGDDVILNCSSDREVHLCRWKTPYLNTYIVGEGIYVETGRIAWKGADPKFDCTIQISHLELRDSGTWVCEIGSSTNQNFQVQTKEFQIVIETPLKLSAPTALMQNANTDATLVCHANKPFDECLWTTPYGSTYSFKGSDSSHENGRISFFGFTETDCGIIVSNVGPQDNGGWLCQLHSKAGNFFQNATDVVPLFTDSSSSFPPSSAQPRAISDYEYADKQTPSPSPSSKLPTSSSSSSSSPKSSPSYFGDDAIDYVGGDFDRVQASEAQRNPVTVQIIQIEDTLKEVPGIVRDIKRIGNKGEVRIDKVDPTTSPSISLSPSTDFDDDPVAGIHMFELSKISSSGSTSPAKSSSTFGTTVTANPLSIFESTTSGLGVNPIELELLSRISGTRRDARPFKIDFQDEEPVPKSPSSVVPQTTEAVFTTTDAPLSSPIRFRTTSRHTTVPASTSLPSNDMRRKEIVRIRGERRKTNEKEKELEKEKENEDEAERQNRLKEEAQKDVDEKERAANEARRQKTEQEIQRRRAEERQRKQEEAIRRAREEEEKRRQQQEEEDKKKKEEQEEKKRKEEELKKQREEEEEEKKRKEEELKKQREEEEEKKRLEEAEKKRKLEEERKQKEEEERKRKEELEREEKLVAERRILEERRRLLAEQRKKEEENRLAELENKRRLELQRIRQEEQKRREEAQRKEELEKQQKLLAERRAREEAALAAELEKKRKEEELQKKKEEEARQAREEAARRAEIERKRKEDLERQQKLEEERRTQEELARKAALAQSRKEAQERQLAEQRRLEEENQKKLEEEQKKKLEEERRKQEQIRRVEAERRRKQEEERTARLEAQKRRDELERRRKAESEKRQREEEAKQKKLAEARLAEQRKQEEEELEKKRREEEIRKSLERIREEKRKTELEQRREEERLRKIKAQQEEIKRRKEEQDKLKEQQRLVQIQIQENLEKKQEEEELRRSNEAEQKRQKELDDAIKKQQQEIDRQRKAELQQKIRDEEERRRTESQRALDPTSNSLNIANLRILDTIDGGRKKCVVASDPAHGNITCGSVEPEEGNYYVPDGGECVLFCKTGFVSRSVRQARCINGFMTRLECVRPDAMILIGGKSDTYGVLSSVELVTGRGVCRGAVPELPAMRWRAITSTLEKDKVITCGGVNIFGDPKSNCWILSFDPDPSWSVASPMNVARDAAAWAFEENALFVFGGSLGKLSGYTDSVEMYNINSGQWVEGPPMTSSRYSHCAVSLGNGSVIVTGGYGGLNLAERFDISTGTWTQLPQLNPIRAQHGCALVNFNGKEGVIVVGGDSGGTRLKDVRFLSLENPNEWKKLEDLNTARWGRPAVGVIGGRITVAAGWNGVKDLDTVEYYDERETKWKLTSSRLQTERRWPSSTPISLSVFPKCVQKRQ